MSAPGVGMEVGTWITKAEALQLTEWSERYLHAKVTSGEIRTRDGRSKARNGRFEKEYLASSLPPSAQKKLHNQQLPVLRGNVLPGQQTLFPPAPAACMDLRLTLTDEAQVQQAAERWEILRPILEYNSTRERYEGLRLRDGRPVTSLSRLVLYLCEFHKISRATLFNWRARYIKGGIPALADAQRKDRGKSHWMENNPDAKSIVAAEYLNSHRSKQAAYEALVRWWNRQGYDEAKLLSYEACRRWIESSDMPAPLKVLAREGEARHNERCLPYVRRGYVDLDANQEWMSDHMIHDMLVRNDCFLGLPMDAQMRLRLTMWLDTRTRKAVGYSWTPEGSSRSIITAYRMGALRFGNPLQVYTDNGLDYIKATRGGTKFERIAAEGWEQDIDWLSQSALYRIGVEVRHCIKYHPQSKHIERFFRTLHMRLDSIFAHYLTGKTYDRPDQANEAMAEHKKLVVMGRGDESPLLPASEFIRMAITWIEMDYNNAPHSGEGMEGLSPNAVYDELYPVAERRAADRQVLDQLLYERAQRRVDSCAVRMPGRRYIGADEASAAALYLANETDVIVCYDPHAPESAIATDLEGNKIADLKPETLTAHSSAAHAQIAESMQQRHKLRNAMKDTERQIKRNARQLGHTSSFEDLHSRSLMLPEAVGAYAAPFTTQRVGSERVQADDHAVAPASAAEIAESVQRFLRK